MFLSRRGTTPGRPPRNNRCACAGSSCRGDDSRRCAPPLGGRVRSAAAASATKALHVLSLLEEDVRRYTF
eukprot:2381347-Prymnesium_polylepis.1